MNIANTARVDLQMATEYLSQELDTENYDKNIEWKQLEKELERKRKQYARKHRQAATKNVS